MDGIRVGRLGDGNREEEFGEWRRGGRRDLISRCEIATGRGGCDSRFG